jgi:hypothetical protein
VSIVEIVIASLCGLGGVRSVVVWLRRPFEPAGGRERALYALYLTARSGWWFTLGFFFLGYALVEEPQGLRWFVLVPIVLAGVQLLTGFALGHGHERPRSHALDPELNGHEPQGDPR